MSDFRFTIDPPEPPDFKRSETFPFTTETAENFRVTVTAEHIETGIKMTGAHKVRLFSSEYWRERQNLCDQIKLLLPVKDVA